ncbi:hypothetical protein LZ30DRAFT_718949 [Colletotrichum cereale]|nr:hypothetical protein LZ30DRAFT_718949 [Colletotrichum cereale]
MRQCRTGRPLWCAHAGLHETRNSIHEAGPSSEKPSPCQRAPSDRIAGASPIHPSTHLPESSSWSPGRWCVWPEASAMALYPRPLFGQAAYCAASPDFLRTKGRSQPKVARNQVLDWDSHLPIIRSSAAATLFPSPLHHYVRRTMVCSPNHR